MWVEFSCNPPFTKTNISKFQVDQDRGRLYENQLRLVWLNLVPRVSHLTAWGERQAVRWEILGTRLVLASCLNMVHSYSIVMYYKTQDQLIKEILYSLTLFWLAQSVQWIFEISAHDVMSADYTIMLQKIIAWLGMFACVLIYSRTFVHILLVSYHRDSAILF